MHMHSVVVGRMNMGHILLLNIFLYLLKKKKKHVKIIQLYTSVFHQGT